MEVLRLWPMMMEVYNCLMRYWVDDWEDSTLECCHWCAGAVWHEWRLVGCGSNPTAVFNFWDLATLKMTTELNTGGRLRRFSKTTSREYDDYLQYGATWRHPMAFGGETYGLPRISQWTMRHTLLI